MNFNRRTFLKALSLIGLSPIALLKFSKPAVARDTDALKKSKFDSLLKTVPKPIVPSRPDLIEMYNICWQIGMNKTERGTPENGFVEQGRY